VSWGPGTIIPRIPSSQYLQCFFHLNYSIGIIVLNSFPFILIKEEFIGGLIRQPVFNLICVGWDLVFFLLKKISSLIVYLITLGGNDLPMPYNGGYTQQILKLRKERFLILCSSVQEGIDDGTIRSDVDPVEIAVLLSSISKNISKFPSDHEKLLKSREINHEKYFTDVGDLIDHMTGKG